MAIENTVYLITGGAGSLGRRLTDELLKSEERTIRILDNHENSIARMQSRLLDPKKQLRFFLGDIRDKERMKLAMENVDVCICCAAQKHVDLGEYSPFESIKTNVIGTQNCIEAALETSVDKFLYISSDKAVHAVSTYGRCKALAERLTLDANNYKGNRLTKFSVARPPNYIDSDGSVFELWKFQKENNLPITVTDKNMERFFMPFSEIVQFVICCLDFMEGGEIFIPIGAKRMRIMDLAKKVSSNIEIIGMRPGERLIEHLFTNEELMKAERTEGMFVIK